MRPLRWLKNPWTRGVLVLIVLAAALLAIWWRGPDWDTVYHAFEFVQWRWVAVGVALNLASTLARAMSWNLTIDQALPPPHPRFTQVFSAFGIGLLGNAVLPARAGELARVAVLRRHLPHGEGTSATLLGTVFAHRLFDLPAVALLVVYVLLTAKIPHWAVTSLALFGLVAVALLAVGLLTRGPARQPAPAGGWDVAPSARDGADRASPCCEGPFPRRRRCSARSAAGSSSCSPFTR